MSLWWDDGARLRQCPDDKSTNGVIQVPEKTLDLDGAAVQDLNLNSVASPLNDLQYVPGGSSMATRIHLKAGAERHGNRAKLCANGCGQIATTHDVPCNKELCWYHFEMEHPYQLDWAPVKTPGIPSSYSYYGS